MMMLGTKYMMHPHLSRDVQSIFRIGSMVLECIYLRKGLDKIILLIPLPSGMSKMFKDKKMLQNH